MQRSDHALKHALCTTCLSADAQSLTCARWRGCTWRSCNPSSATFARMRRTHSHCRARCSLRTGNLRRGPVSTLHIRSRWHEQRPSSRRSAASGAHVESRRRSTPAGPVRIARGDRPAGTPS
eukprot:scaffold12691_cov108-Isochrysis_galbana.AAC.3